MPKPKATSFADDLAAVTSPSSPRRSFADDLASVDDVTPSTRERTFADDLARVAVEPPQGVGLSPVARAVPRPAWLPPAAPSALEALDLAAPTPDELEVIAAAPPTQARRRWLPPEPPAPTDAPMTALETTLGLAPLAVRGMKAGGASIAEGAAAGLEWMAPEGSALKDVGYGARTYWQDVAARNAAPRDIAFDPIFEKPDVLMNPEWWAYNGPQVITTMLPFLIPGLGGAAAGAKGAQLLRLAPRAAQLMTAAGGAGAGALTEGLLEGSLAYSEAIDAGKSDAEASAIAASVAGKNVALIGATGMLEFAPPVRGVLAKTLSRALLEGGQESGQEAIANVAAGRPAGENIGTAGVLGALGGTVGGPVIDAAVSQDARTTMRDRLSNGVHFMREKGTRLLARAKSSHADHLEDMGLRPRTPAAAAPDAPVSVVEPVQEPPLPVVPTDPGRPGDSFAADLAAVEGTKPVEIIPNVLPTERADLEARITAARAEGRDDLAALEQLQALRSEPGSFAADLASIQVEKPEVEPPASTPSKGSVAEEDVPVPGKPGQVNVPAEKVDIAAVPFEQRRELRRILAELEEVPFAKHTFIEQRGKGGTPEIIPGHAGAPVYNDIVTTDRAGRPQGTRTQVITAIRGFLEGKRTALSDRAVDVARRRLAGDRTLSKPFMPLEAGDPPGAMIVRRRKVLSEEGRSVESRFAERAAERPRELVDEYRRRFGHVVSADLAKELAPEYTTPEGRAKFDEATHHTSSAVARSVYREMLQEPTPAGRTDLVVFTAGGTGSGKTSSLDMFQSLKDDAHVVYDSTLSNEAGAVGDIEAALEAGKEVGIVYTVRDVREAFTRGVLPRAEADGRAVRIGAHLSTHRNAPKVLRAIAQRFEGNPRVNIIVVDNRGASDARQVADLSLLEAQAYDEVDVRRQLQADLDEALRRGTISRRTHEAASEVREGLAEGSRPAGPRRTEEEGDDGEVAGPFADAKSRTSKPNTQSPKPGAARRRAEPSADALEMRTGNTRPLPAKRPDTAIAKVTPAIRPTAIVKKLQKVLGSIPVRTGHFREHAYGIYKPDVQSIRLKVANNLQTFFHEEGHHLDIGILKIDRKDARWKDELLKLGQPTSRPSYTKAKQRAEGAAEFLRLWMTEPATLKQHAPQYLAEFERRLEAQPELADGLRQVQQDIQDLLSQPPAVRGRQRIDFDGKEPGVLATAAKDPRGAIRDLARATVDDLQPLRVAVEAMRDGRILNPQGNAYVLARIARGAAGKAEAFLEHGVRLKKGQFAGPSLADAIAPVKHRLEDFGTYLVALRAKELHGRGIEPGLARDEAAAIIAETEADPEAAEFARARDNVYAYQDATLEYARQYGAMNRDQLAAIKKLNQAYVPMQRVLDATSAAYQLGAKRIADRVLPVKRIRGSGRDIVNPFESIVKNTFAIVDMVEKNRAMQALVRQAEESAGSAKWIERIPDPQVATRFNLQKLAKDVREALEEGDVELPGMFDQPSLDDLLDQMVTVFTPATFGKNGEQIITVIRKGDRQFWQVNDQALYDAITVMGPAASTSSLHWLTRKPVALLRSAATLTPGFILRNPGRDTLVAYMQSKYGFVPVLDTLKGLVSQVRGDRDAKLFFSSGVSQATLAGQHRQHQRELVERLNRKGASYLKHIVFHPVDLLRALSSQLEVATRLGEFKLALDAGGVERGVVQRLLSGGQARPALTEASLTKATLAARDVTTDFSRAGTLSREANELYAFFNARVQGYVRMAETMATDPIGTVLKLGSLAAFSWALWWMNHDDEEYDAKEAWEKKTYWHFRLSEGLPFIRIPKPFEWGYGPDMVEATLDYLHKEDPDGLKRLEPHLGSMAQLAVALAPTAIAPLLEAGMNYSAFRDTHIVRPWDLDLDPELQYNQWTSQTAKTLGKVMGVSPLKIDHLIFGYTAGFGRGVVESIDEEMRTVGLAPADKRPAKGLSQRTGIGVFLDDGSIGFSSRHIQDLYDAAEAIERAEGSIKQFVKLRDVDRARERVREATEEPWYPHRARIKDAKKAFKDLAPTLKAIYDAPPDKMTAAEKRQALNEVADRMNTIAQRALGRRPHRDDSVQSDVEEALGMR